MEKLKRLFHDTPPQKQNRENFSRKIAFDQPGTFASHKPLGSLEAFARYAEEKCLLESLAEIPIFSSGFESEQLQSALGALLLAVLHGQQRFSQVDALKMAPADAASFGLLHSRSHQLVRRGIRHFSGAREQKLLRRKLNDFSSTRPRADCGWICHLDSTKGKELRFHSANAVVHTAWNPASRICVDVCVESAPHDRAPFWNALESFSISARPSIVRGGSEYASEANLHAAESLGVDYIFELPGFRSLPEAVLANQYSGYPIDIWARFDGWSQSRRVVVTGIGPHARAIVTSLSIAAERVEELLPRGSFRSNPFDENATWWPWIGFGCEDIQASRSAALLIAIFHNSWMDFASRARVSNYPVPQRLIQNPRWKSPVCAVFVGALLSSGMAFTANPQPAERPPPPVQTAAETDADFLLEPMQPSSPDAGFQTIQAATDYPLAPLPDPNVDDVPPLNGEQLGLVQVPEEATDRMWRIRPIVATGVTYDDNIFITNTDRKGDLIYNINLGFALEVGDYRNMEGNFLLLEYLAEGFFFNRYASQNSFDQQASLLAQYRFHQLAVQLESRYQYLNGAEREVGAFTTRSLYYNALRLLYDYSEKTDIDLELSQSTNDYPSNLSSSDYQASLGFDYALFPKTTAGLQAIAGLQRTQDSPDMWFQTLNVRFNHGATGKVVFNASGGVQFNQYVSGGEPMRILPVFSLGAQYQLFNKTSLSLVGYRNLQSSPSIAGQDYIATGGELGISQALADKLTFAIATGYENDTYVANTVDTDATRVDNFYFIRPSLSYSFLKYMKASLSYEHRVNASTQQQDSWYDNQFSCELEGQF